MGNDVAEDVGLPSAQAIKVHGRMCSKLLPLVRRISKIFPELENARPRCSAGIESLCLLNDTIVGSKSLLQRCCESSILYLALTGDAMLARCKKYGNLFHQSLSQIQNMVPVLLAAKISGIVADLKTTEFCLDPSEAKAGKILRELLHRCNNTDSFEKEAALTAIHDASSRLHIVSQTALLIEKRSIRKMIDNFAEKERENGKRWILIFFLNLLKKYGKSMPLEQKINVLSNIEQPLPFVSPYRLSREVELCVDYRPDEARIGMLSRAIPPEEFICPLSSKLMYDPVVIASGQTCERMLIEKWFEQGNDTCPKMKRKLPNISYTSNTGMKDLIRKWCTEHGVSLPDPNIHEIPLNHSWETSSNSITSITSSLYNLNLPADFSSVSLGSHPDLDHSNTEISRTMATLHEDGMELLSKFGELPWDFQCNAVEDIKNLLIHRNETQSGIPSEKFAQLILTFLKDACDVCDMVAQMAGCELLLEFVQKDGDGVLCIKKDAYDILASFLDKDEIAQKSLSILVVLSSHQRCCNNITSSGVVTGILNILNRQIHQLLEPALHLLSNLLSNGDVTSSIVPSKIIPKLVPLFEDENLVGHCMNILRKMCENENGRVSITETEGCVASIVRVLEIDNQETQENALSVLLPLCLQRVEYCQLVMEKDIILNLLTISRKGNSGGMAAATELLRILRNVIDSTEESCCTNMDPVVEMNRPNPAGTENNTLNTPSFLGKFFGKKKK